MKKNYFFGAMAAFGLLAFSSCSNDDDPVLGQEQEELTGEQVIVLDMQNTDVLSTKSRPLYSTENKGSKEVTDVVLYVFKEGDNAMQELHRIIPVANWNNTAEAYKYGHQKTIKLKGSEGDFAKLEEGTYTIYAVGQNERVVDGNPTPFKFVGDKKGDGYSVPGLKLEVPVPAISHNFATTPGQGFSYFLTKPVSYTTDNPAQGTFASRAVGEVFSGQSQPITFEGKEGFNTTVLLKRQVAGVLGYFSNIPAGKEVETKAYSSRKLRLVASNSNDCLDMTIKLDDQSDDATEVGHEAVITGFKSGTNAKLAKTKFSDESEGYIVYEIDLTKWFDFDETTGDWKNDVTTEDNNVKYLGYNGSAKGWHNPLVNTNSSVTVADGAVLGAEFVIPFKKDETLNTFELQLIGKPTQTAIEGGAEDKEKILQKWSVKLDKESVGLEGDKELNYSVYRNHLYQIGKRGSGDNPNKPGEGDDKPQPLDNSQELVIKINDNWEIIHDMEID